MNWCPVGAGSTEAGVVQSTPFGEVEITTRALPAMSRCDHTRWTRPVASMAIEGNALVRKPALVVWSNGEMFATTVVFEKVCPPSRDFATRMASLLLDVAKRRQAT